MCEDPRNSIQTIKDIAGHVSERMLAKYAHIRIENKRKTLMRSLETQYARAEKRPPQSVEQNSEVAQQLATALTKLLQ